MLDESLLPLESGPVPETVIGADIGFRARCTVFSRRVMMAIDNLHPLVDGRAKKRREGHRMPGTRSDERGHGCTGEQTRPQ